MSTPPLDSGAAARAVQLLESEGAQAMQSQLINFFTEQRDTALRSPNPEDREAARRIALWLEGVAIPWRQQRITALRARAKEDL